MSDETFWNSYNRAVARAAEADGWQSRAEQAEGRVYELRNALNLVLDQVDYTSGACRANEMVGAVLGKNIIDLARRIAKGGD